MSLDENKFDINIYNIRIIFYQYLHLKYIIKLLHMHFRETIIFFSFTLFNLSLNIRNVKWNTLLKWCKDKIRKRLSSLYERWVIACKWHFNTAWGYLAIPVDVFQTLLCLCSCVCIVRGCTVHDANRRLLHWTCNPY